MKEQRESELYGLGLRYSCFIVALLLAMALFLESSLRVVDLLYPLERPVSLRDTYSSVLFSGSWLDGSHRFYTYRPGIQAMTHGHPFLVNSLGFCGPEIPDKTAKRRILVLGDSITSGIGVMEEARFTNIAQRMVNAEIVNMSVEGWDAPQYAMALERYGEQLKPDCLVVGFYVNDTRTDFSHYKYDPPQMVDRLLARVLTYRLFKPFYDPLYRVVHGIPSSRKILEDSYNPNSAQWKTFLTSLNTLQAWSKQHLRHQPAVILVTDPEDSKQGGFYLPARTAFEQHGFTWIEAHRVRPEQSIYQPVSRWEAHANEQTHYVLGKALALWIRQTQPSR